MLAQPTSPEKCGPCLTEGQRKKQIAQEAKELKATINFLSRNNGYDREVLYVLGNLVNQLIRLGEFK